MASTLDLGHRRIDLDEGVVIVGRRQIALTNREREALRFLAARAGDAVERDALLEAVWGLDEPVLTRAVDQAMVRLRKKIEPEPRRPRHLLTVHRVGYRLVLPDGPVLGTSPTNLSLDQGTLYGRDDALATLDVQMESRTWCTLKGPPGVGKTRLARAWARRALDRFPGGVWFCALGEARTRRDVVATVAEVVGVRAASDLEALEARLGWVFASRGRTLLVLDDLEHLAAEALGAGPRWLEEATELRVLATSRLPTGLAVEGVWPVPVLSEAPGVALFAERAARVGVDLRGRSRAVAQVVQRLDGLPLALELAAARLSQLPLTALQERLEAPLRVASGGPGRTLREAIGWSWELLDAPERSALARFSLFHGSFDADGAEAILEPGIRDPLDLLASLERQSLLTLRRSRDDVRYALLESVRQFAAEQLEGLGERQDAEERLERWFLRRSPWPMPLGPQLPDGAWRRLLADQRTFGATLDRALERGDAVAVGRLGVLFANLTSHVGDLATHHAVWERILDVTAGLDDPELRARLLDSVARLHVHSGRAQSSPTAAERAVAALGDDPSPLVAAWVYETRAQEFSVAGDVDQARDVMERALAFAERAGCLSKTSALLTWLSQFARLRGSIDEAHALCRQAEALGELGDTDTGMILMELTPVRYALGDLDGAIEAARRCRDHYRAKDDGWSETIAVTNLGCMLGEAGRLHEAATAFEQAADFYRLRGDRRRLALAMSNLAQCFVDDGRFTEAVPPLQRALALYERLVVPMQCGRLHCMLGIVMHFCHETSEAERHFDAAMTWFDGRGFARWTGLNLAHRAAVRCVRGANDGFGEARAWIEAHPHPEAQSVLDALEAFVDVPERPVAARARLDRVSDEAKARSSNLRHAVRLVERALTGRG